MSWGGGGGGGGVILFDGVINSKSFICLVFSMDISSVCFYSMLYNILSVICQVLSTALSACQLFIPDTTADAKLWRCIHLRSMNFPLTRTRRWRKVLTAAGCFIAYFGFRTLRTGQWQQEIDISIPQRSIRHIAAVCKLWIPTLQPSLIKGNL